MFQGTGTHFNSILCDSIYLIPKIANLNTKKYIFSYSLLRSTNRSTFVHIKNLSFKQIFTNKFTLLLNTKCTNG